MANDDDQKPQAPKTAQPDDETRRKYREQARQFHPDLVASDGKEKPLKPPVKSPDSPAKKGKGAAVFAEGPEEQFSVPASSLKLQTRRDFLLYSAGAVATAIGFWWLLPDEVHTRLLPDKGVHKLDTLAARAGLSSARKETFLGRVLTFDDDVAEALYSPDRSVPTYDPKLAKADFLVQTDVVPPDDTFLADWSLTLSGLASGKEVVLTLAELMSKFGHHDQVTRLCCVEGWSVITGWGGVRFADILKAYPPAPGAKWAAMISEVSVDSNENNYYVSIDIPTAQHPQTLLATHQNGKPLSVGHGAPLRLVAPMKLGLKNIKHVTRIEYTDKQPPDYWAEQGYSKYDGL